MSPRKDVDWSFLAFQSWYFEKSGERPRNASAHTDCAHQMQMFQTAAKMLTYSYWKSEIEDSNYILGSKFPRIVLRENLQESPIFGVRNLVFLQMFP
jgi:hypothetical protein